MTVPYTRDIASASYWASTRLLFRWRGSIWKSVLPEFSAWMAIFYGFLTAFYIGEFKTSEIFFKYYNVNTNRNKEYITTKNATILDDYWIISLCRNFDDGYSLPLVMLLSFYSSKAFERWQFIFNNIAYSENFALTVNAFIRGDNRIVKLARQTVIRHAILAQILIYRDVSISVRKRFPSLESLIDAGYLKRDELKLLERSSNQYNIFHVPFVWITTLLSKLRLDGHILSDPTFVNLITEMKEFRRKLETVFNYDCVPIPLAYPQIVSVAVRMHVIVNMIGKLFIFSRKDGIWKLNGNFGLVNGPEIFVFLAWLKVAEILANPLGEDDDDLELNHIIDRNYFISRSIIEIHDQCPILEETEMNPTPKYDEHAKNLGGASHRLMGSAVGSKVDVGRMVEVEPTHKPELRHRVCIPDLLGSFTDKGMDDKVAIVEHAEDMGRTSVGRNINSKYRNSNDNLPVFCVKVPSIYDQRSLRSLTQEEICERYGGDRRLETSLIDMSDPSPLSASRLATSSNIAYDNNSCRL